ncbi:alpha/beta hydrolase [Christiangramia fulva]|uniref:Alpha/beta hydrolase n=1 Tax=Christiangramia fulva TaxID=2126553 RepID=A0A2R3Z3Z3_9FLAO|nr:alpha/beta hydrolase [Christiangramia fulva]AVR44985.1 alpha/beta hydrolase [Christiangramia fulva]
MTIDFEGAKINFSSEGEGNPLVLLHGFLEDIRIWNDLAKELKKERQVICIDLPGHGKSEGFSDVHTMAEMANAVKKVLDEIEVENISIAGHSMGGYVSLEFLNNFPKMVKSIMLINSTPVDDSVEKKKAREKAVELVSKNKKAYINMAIPNLFSRESKVKFCPEIEDLKNRAMKMEVKNIQAALRGMKIRTNHKSLLRSASIQKAIVAGEEDPILDFNELKSIAEECDCNFYATENGHNSYIEDAYNLRKNMHFID